MKNSKLILALALVVLATFLLLDDINLDVYAPTKVEKTEDTILMYFVGDIMLSRSVGSVMKNKKDYKFPFLKVGEELAKADITFGNLESPISDKGVNQGSIYSFRADPKSIEGLTYAGFDIVSVANNHIWDYGKLAMLDTFSRLASSSIEYVGAGKNYEEAYGYKIIERKGIKVAFLAYTNLYPASLVATSTKPGVAGAIEGEIKKGIKKAKENADIVVASFHFGDEYKTKSNATQQKLAEIAISNGADLVVGHHPHVVQEVINIGTTTVAYSLGNFVFDQSFSTSTMESIVLGVFADNEGVKNVIKRQIRINSDFQPEFATSTK